MAEAHRLRHLKVGVAREDGVDVALGEVDEDAAHLAQQGDQALGPGAHGEPEVGGHLVVATASGVELAADRTDPLRQPLLEVHVDVLERDGPLDAAPLDVGDQVPQPLDERDRLVGSDDALLPQHGGVGDRALEVLERHRAVDVDRGVERLHELVGRLGEAAAPHAVGAHRGTGGTVCHSPPTTLRSTLPEPRAGT